MVDVTAIQGPSEDGMVSESHQGILSLDPPCGVLYSASESEQEGGSNPTMTIGQMAKRSGDALNALFPQLAHANSQDGRGAGDNALRARREIISRD